MSYFVLSHEKARQRAIDAIRTSPDGYVVKIKEPTRTLEANAKMWAMLAEVSKQVCWHGRYLDAESWKHIFSSSVKKLDSVPNLDGTGFVVLGASTSKMTKKEMSDLIELIYSFGAQHKVNFKE